MSGKSLMQARLAFNQIDDVTSALLKEHRDFIMSELPGVLDRFYDHLSRF